MTFPVVTEIKPVLEPVTADPFLGPVTTSVALAPVRGRRIVD